MYPQYQYPNKDNDITSIKNRVKLMKKQNKKVISVQNFVSKNIKYSFMKLKNKVEKNLP